MRLLLVEDDLAVRRLVTNRLEYEGVDRDGGGDSSPRLWPSSTTACSTWRSSI